MEASAGMAARVGPHRVSGSGVDAKSKYNNAFEPAKSSPRRQKRRHGRRETVERAIPFSPAAAGCSTSHEKKTCLSARNALNI